MIRMLRSIWSVIFAACLILSLPLVIPFLLLLYTWDQVVLERLSPAQRVWTRFVAPFVVLAVSIGLMTWLLVSHAEVP